MERFITGAMAVEGRVRQLPHYRQIRATALYPGEFVPDFSALSLDLSVPRAGSSILVALHQRVQGRDVAALVIMIGQPQAYEAGFTIEWVADEKALLLALGLPCCGLIRISSSAGTWSISTFVFWYNGPPSMICRCAGDAVVPGCAGRRGPRRDRGRCNCLVAWCLMA